MEWTRRHCYCKACQATWYGLTPGDIPLECPVCKKMEGVDVIHHINRLNKRISRWKAVAKRYHSTVEATIECLTGIADGIEAAYSGKKKDGN